MPKLPGWKRALHPVSPIICVGLIIVSSAISASGQPSHGVGVHSSAKAFTLGRPPLLAALLQGPVSGPVTYVYDDLGRLIAAIDAAGNAAVYSYDAVGNILSIRRYNTATDLSIISFNPTSGSAGSPVTITGTGFSASASQNSVSFNGVLATVTSATPNQIVTSVPAGATTGPLTVTSPLGSTTSASAFHVGPATGAPVINGFTPAVGSAGATITISGSNFDASPGNNHLRFNDVANGVVTASTSTTITATVPAGVGSGKIKLATPTGNTVSSSDFFIPLLSYTATAVGQTGRITVGTPQAVSLASGQIAIFTFDATRGQHLSVQTTNSSLSGGTAYIVRPDGSVWASTNFSTSDFTYALPAPVPSTGTYALGIAAGQSGGSVTAQVSGSFDIDTAITLNGPPVTTTTTTAGQDVWLRFTTTADKQIVLQVTNVTVPSANIQITGPTGEPLGITPLAINNNPAGQLFFLDQQTIPVTGNYAIHIVHSGTYTGSETTQLSSAQDFVAPIIPGGAAVRVPASGDTVIGQNGRLTFTAAAGQKVSLNVTNSTYGPLASSCTVSIKDPSGTGLSAISCTSGQGYYLDTLTLASAGTYTVFVDPQQRTTGNATIQLNDASDATGTIAIDGAAVTATTTVQGEDARFSFNATAGQKVFLQVSNVTNPGATVILVRPDGTQQAFIVIGPTTPGQVFNLDTQTLATTGTYVLWVRHSTNYVGSETLQLTSAPDVSGTINIDGSAVTATTTLKGQDARLTFSATAGQRIFTQVTSVTNPSATLVLLRSDGTQQASTAINNSGQTFWIDTQTLATAGTYTLWVQHSSTNVGSETLQVKSVPADFTSSITIGGSSVRVPAAGNNALGQNATLTVSVTAGQKFSVNLSSNTYSPATACFLTATDPSGNTVANGNCGSGSSPIFVSAATAGAYNLFIDPQGMTLGTATFALVSNNDVTGTIAIDGSPVTVTTTTAGQDARVTFSGTAGQRIFVRASSVTNPSATLALVTPANTTQASTPIGSSPAGQVFFIDTQVLPTTGTYTLWIQHSGTNVGTETLQINSVPSDIAGSITLGGPPVRVPSSGDSVLGQNAVLSFTATAGQKASMSISNTTYSSGNCIVYIKNPAGTQLSSGYCGIGNPLFIDAVSLSSSGTYTVLVDPQGIATGNTTVQLNNSSDITGTIPTDGTAVTVSMGLGQDIRYTFNATAGQRVALRVTNVTTPAATVFLLQPGNFTQTSFNINNNPAGQLFFMDTQTLASAGTYTIFVRHSGSNTGNVTLQLNTVPADYSAALTLGVVTPVPTTGSLAIGQNARVTFSGSGGYQANIQFTNNTIGPLTATLLSTDGSTTLTSVTSSAASFSLPLAMLPATGTYTILIDPTGAATGSISVQVTQTGSPTPVPNRSGTAVDPSNPLSSNLVGLFLMNEGTGTTDKNLVNSQTATFAGTTTPIWNTTDPSVVLRGTTNSLSSYLDAGTDSTFDQLPTNKITVVAKVYLNGLTTGGIAEKTDASITGFTFGLNNTGALSVYVLKSATPMQISTGAGAISTGQWAQLAFTWDGTNGTASAAHIYVNGVEQGKSVANDGSGSLNYLGATSKSFRIGNGSYGGVLGSLNGKVAYLEVYKYRVLTPTELNQLDAQLPITTDVVGTTIENGTATTVTTTTNGQNAHVSFQGWAGQQVNVQLSGSTLSQVTVKLIAPDGSTVTSTSSSASSFGLPTATVPLTGTYDVLMQAPANAGSITVGVTTALGGRANGSVIDTANPLSTNLVGLFLMNEGTGTTDKNIVDSQTAAFSGTTIPVWNTNDPSIGFKGTTASLSSYLDAGTDLNFDQLPTNKMTVVAKVFLNSVTAGGIAEKTDDSVTGFSFGLDGTGALSSYVLKSTTPMHVATGSGAVTSGQWVQVAFTWDSSVGTAAAAHLYVNGVEQTKTVSQDGSGTLNYSGATNKSFRIGNVSYSPLLGSFNGRMLYLAVYRGRVLTITELNQLDSQLPIR